VRRLEFETSHARIFTDSRSNALQLTPHPCSLYVDRASGKDTSSYSSMSYCHLRARVTGIVHRLDRLARNLDELRRLVRQLTKRGHPH
jgi:hypothetical protein